MGVECKDHTQPGHTQLVWKGSEQVTWEEEGSRKEPCGTQRSPVQNTDAHVHKGLGQWRPYPFPPGGAWFPWTPRDWGAQVHQLLKKQVR